MDIKNIFQRITGRLKPQHEMDDEVVLKFIAVLENLQREGLTCDELYAQLDEFVEREVKSHDASRIMPLIQDHLDVCPDCCDEYEALLEILENTQKTTA